MRRRKSSTKKGFFARLFSGKKKKTLLDKVNDSASLMGFDNGKTAKNLSSSYYQVNLGKKARAEANKTKKTSPVFRAFGLNWKIVLFLIIVGLSILALFKLGSSLRLFLFFAIFVMVVIFIVRAVKGKSNYSWKGWSALGVIGLVSIAFLGGSIRMAAVPINTSDVYGHFEGFNLSVPNWINPTKINNYQYDKTIDATTYTVDGTKVNVLGNLWSTTDKRFYFDFDNLNRGMPNIDIYYEGDTIPCAKDGTELSDFRVVDKEMEVSINGTSYDLVYFETYVKTRVFVVIIPDVSYSIDYSAWHMAYYFTSFSGEVDLKYNTYINEEPWTMVARDSDGSGIMGEFALGITVHKLKFSDQDILGDDNKFLSSAVVDIDCITKKSLFQVTELHDRPDKIVVPSPSGIVPIIGGRYNVMSGMGQCLMYRTVSDAVTANDACQTNTIDTITLEDVWLETVYTPIEIDVLLGAFGGYDLGSSLTEVKQTQYVSYFSTELEFVSTIISAYQLNIDVDGGIDIDGGPGDGDGDTWWTDFWNTFVGSITKFWMDGIIGKIVIIGVPVIILCFTLIYLKGRRGGGGGRGRRKDSSDGGSGKITINVGKG